MRWSVMKLGLEPVDLDEDFLVFGEAVRRLIVVHTLPVDVDGEDATDAFVQISDDAVFVLDGGLQTGGLRKIVSLAAVSDPDVHPILLCVRLPRMIRSAPQPVKCAC